MPFIKQLHAEKSSWWQGLKKNGNNIQISSIVDAGIWCWKGGLTWESFIFTNNRNCCLSLEFLDSFVSNTGVIEAEWYKQPVTLWQMWSSDNTLTLLKIMWSYCDLHKYKRNLDPSTLFSTLILRYDWEVFTK